ncbi:accessory gene regulator ArgB-like protein [Paenibacillus sp. sgz5001063]|uniref:accessory gene regulator ArgB-like protein n=1 Tax=Paenibacillus sp. sgz5001063 TaxID=3242474 RepID=UPI0036D27D52
MNSLALKISAAIKRANPEETSSLEVMQYALNIILNTLFTFLAAMVIGLFFNNVLATIVFYISFSLLRICSGGFHLKTAWACNITTALLCSLTPLMNPVGQALWILNVVSVIIMLVFAPNPDKNAQIPLRWFPALKLISVGLVSVNFLIGSSVIGLAFIVQSLTVIPWKRRL